jgi:hypothetical protein
LSYRKVDTLPPSPGGGRSSQAFALGAGLGVVDCWRGRGRRVYMNI